MPENRKNAARNTTHGPQNQGGQPPLALPYLRPTKRNDTSPILSSPLPILYGGAEERLGHTPPKESIQTRESAWPLEKKNKKNTVTL